MKAETGAHGHSGTVTQGRNGTRTQDFSRIGPRAQTHRVAATQEHRRAGEQRHRGTKHTATPARQFSSVWNYRLVYVSPGLWDTPGYKPSLATNQVRAAPSLATP